MSDQTEREALLELTTTAMSAAIAWFAEEGVHIMRRLPPDGSIDDALGDWPERFLDLRPDLTEFLRSTSPDMATTGLGREVLHHIEIVSSDGLPMPRLVCTAAPGADCRRRPEDDSVGEWGPGYDGPMIDAECWAIDWVNADSFEDQVTLADRAGYVVDNGIVLARIPVDVKYDEGVTAIVLTTAPTMRPVLSDEEEAMLASLDVEGVSRG